MGGARDKRFASIHYGLYAFFLESCGLWQLHWSQVWGLLPTLPILGKAGCTHGIGPGHGWFVYPSLGDVTSEQLKGFHIGSYVCQDVTCWVAVCFFFSGSMTLPIRSRSGSQQSLDVFAAGEAAAWSAWDEEGNHLKVGDLWSFGGWFCLHRLVAVDWHPKTWPFTWV